MNVKSQTKTSPQARITRLYSRSHNQNPKVSVGPRSVRRQWRLSFVKPIQEVGSQAPRTQCPLTNRRALLLGPPATGKPVSSINLWVQEWRRGPGHCPPGPGPLNGALSSPQLPVSELSLFGLGLPCPPQSPPHTHPPQRPRRPDASVQLRAGRRLFAREGSGDGRINGGLSRVVFQPSPSVAMGIPRRSGKSVKSDKCTRNGVKSTRSPRRFTSTQLYFSCTFKTTAAVSNVLVREQEAFTRQAQNTTNRRITVEKRTKSSSLPAE